MTRLIALVVAGALAASPAFAAKDPCKDVSIKKDAFGTTRVYDKMDIQFRKTGEQTVLGFEFSGGGGYGGFAMSAGQQVPAGQAVEVLLADGTIVPLATSAPAGPVVYNVMGVVVTKYPMSVTVSPEQLAQLLGQDIKAARVMQGAETWMSMEVKPPDAQKWRATVQCMIGS